MTKKALVEEFFMKNILPPMREIQYSIFVSKYGPIEKKYFLSLAKKYSKIVTIKTGGVNSRFDDITRCGINRSLNDINQDNCTHTHLLTLWN